MYQDLPYEEELRVKRGILIATLSEKTALSPEIVSPVVASPAAYYSRSRVDLTLRRLRSGGFAFGFMPLMGKKVIEVEACMIARREISDFIPALGAAAREKMPADYNNANIVVKTGDDGRIFWGGIGRRSLSMKSEDYLWTEIRGRRIHYSLETFFQANLSILPRLMDVIEDITGGKDNLFLDLYSGVGLFGISLADLFGRIIMIEEHPVSAEIAAYNIAYHKLSHAEIHSGSVENLLPGILTLCGNERPVAMIDPPRKGLSQSALATLIKATQLKALLYLSCHPESLARDLAEFEKAGWVIERVVPFDFFPKTRHLEILALLRPPA